MPAYYLDITSLPPMEDVLSDMPLKRKLAFNLLMRQADRLRNAAGWILLRNVLGKKSRQVRYGRYGKPFLPGGPHFSLSHSGIFAILATDDMPIGVDVEKIQSDENWKKLASHALHPEERKYLADNPEPGTFFDLWTLKESYLKLKGTGLNYNPALFAIIPKNGQFGLNARPEFKFNIYRELEGYSAAICCYRTSPPATIVPLKI